MRSLLITGVLFATLAAQTPMPRNIAVSRSFGNPGQVGLFIAASDGSDERPLLDSKDSDYDPVWAPDGSSIVFTSDRAGSADLFRVRPDGTSLERLTTDPAYDDQAAFSPDGKQLVFVSTRGGGTARLWTMDLATRRVEALTSEKGGDFRPSWSPDGKWIAFSFQPRSQCAIYSRALGAPSIGRYLYHSPGWIRDQKNCGERWLLRKP
jgi:TolB protein